MTRPLILALTLAACGPGLAARYAAGNRALSTDEGAVYFVVLGPVLQAALNDCIPPGTPGASPTLVIVADVAADGRADNLDVEPASPGTACVERRLRATPLPRPPEARAAGKFPIGLRIDTR